MKPINIILSGIFIIIVSISCNKDPHDIYTESLTGKWTLIEIYGNDHWGGRLGWKKINNGTSIDFTIDNKFFKKYSTDVAYTFIGDFKKVSDSTLKIFQPNPEIPGYPFNIQHYTLNTDGKLILKYEVFEGVVQEKYMKE